MNLINLCVIKKVQGGWTYLLSPLYSPSIALAIKMYLVKPILTHNFERIPDVFLLFLRFSDSNHFEFADNSHVRISCHKLLKKRIKSSLKQLK